MNALRRSNTSCSSRSYATNNSSWIHLRSILIVASSPLPNRRSINSAWSRRRRRALSRRRWRSLFTAEGRIRDGGVKFLKKVRRGGIDPSIRAEVWPFLLGVYDLNSSEAERNITKVQKRKEYEDLRRCCQQLLSHNHTGIESLRLIEFSRNHSHCLDEIELPEGQSSNFDQPIYDETPESKSGYLDEEEEEEDFRSTITNIDPPLIYSESSDSESSFEADPEISKTEDILDPEPKLKRDDNASYRTTEDFATWQRIIRLDAVRANTEWVIYSPSQAKVSEEKTNQSALLVGLKNFDHLEPYMIYHASRLVAILEAYAIYDPEIGYCQGMSDLLSPILAIIEDDSEAFWCFAGFMRKARHNFQLDEIGIRRQLKIVSKIIQSKDSFLYRHLKNLQAEDCFFVYRMVVVLFRRELTFEQTVCLWEVMWADQAAIRAGIRKSAWERIRSRAPPTEDLLLYAIAACVLQRRKLIIESSNSMDEIIRECNSLEGHLDVWRLLDDAHDLVVTLHDKIK